MEHGKDAKGFRGEIGADVSEELWSWLQVVLQPPICLGLDGVQLGSSCYAIMQGLRSTK